MAYTTKKTVQELDKSAVKTFAPGIYNVTLVSVEMGETPKTGEDMLKFTFSNGYEAVELEPDSEDKEEKLAQRVMYMLDKFGADVTLLNAENIEKAGVDSFKSYGDYVATIPFDKELEQQIKLVGNVWAGKASVKLPKYTGGTIGTDLKFSAKELEANDEFNSFKPDTPSSPLDLQNNAALPNLDDMLSESLGDEHHVGEEVVDTSKPSKNGKAKDSDKLDDMPF